MRGNFPVDEQKLGPACTLVSTPDLLLLDEPTVGVESPATARTLVIVYSLVREHGLTVLLSTSYLDEAERCDMTVLLFGGESCRRVPFANQLYSERQILSNRYSESLKPRQLQASLASAGGIVDATLEGRRVRVVSPATRGLKTRFLPD